MSDDEIKEITNNLPINEVQQKICLAFFNSDRSSDNSKKCFTELELSELSPDKIKKIEDFLKKSIVNATFPSVDMRASAPVDPRYSHLPDDLKPSIPRGGRLIKKKNKKTKQKRKRKSKRKNKSKKKNKKVY